MSDAVFTINFRREAFERDVMRSRQRLISLAAWLGYFALFALLLWTYTLNFTALIRRTRQIERQTAQFANSQSLPRKVALDAAQISAIERYHLNPRRWRDKLARLAWLIPDKVVLTSVALNPGGSNQPSDQDRMVIAGSLRGGARQDPMRGVVQLVARLQADSAFSAGYQSIKLSQSRAGTAESAVTEFVIECR